MVRARIALMLPDLPRALEFGGGLEELRLEKGYCRWYVIQYRSLVTIHCIGGERKVKVVPIES